jgi:hypothetical protein
MPVRTEPSPLRAVPQQRRRIRAGDQRRAFHHRHILEEYDTHPDQIFMPFREKSNLRLRETLPAVVDEIISLFQFAAV